SIYDALQAGFGKVVFVIRHDFEEMFREKVLSKYEGSVPVEVVFQSIDALPEGFSVPDGRTKPWGTNHAILMGERAINEPFAVINADDFYGRDAFKVMASYLSGLAEGEKGRYCMVAFCLGNTMTENGSVSRGVCSVTAEGKLDKVVERTAIAFDEEGRITFTDENGQVQHPAADTPVSMNLWGFTPDYFAYSGREFVKFLTNHIAEPKSEFFIPSVVDRLVKNGEATVDVLTTSSRWFGVTYPQDRPGVVENIARLHAEGVYPAKLF
ncbi:MAG: nucleotidyltransferase, partial [Muribaculaceae bacterium]|nr:nucleotidyltransferase [Muribaculaceae bacterium]